MFNFYIMNSQYETKENNYIDIILKKVILKNINFIQTCFRTYYNKEKLVL